MGHTAADDLIALESARSLKTYRAAVDAAVGGFGLQAAMLNRALFEGMATTCWASANPDLAAERFRGHRRHNKGLWSKRYMARRVWCSLPMHELVKAIEDQWDQPEELRIFFAFAHAANNETQHTTVRSLTAPVVSDSYTNLQVDSGPSLEFVEQALYASLWIYVHMLRVTAYHFQIEGRERIMPLFARLRQRCEPIPASDAVGVGRNDPCPWGSGDKFKRCHGHRGGSELLRLASPRLVCGTMYTMQSADETYDFHARAREKQASREQDERDLRSGRKSVEQLCRENELLGSRARTAQVDLDSFRWPG